ncbi:MAG: hypothetical protein ACKOSO_10045, partial [Actinomycetota bacterium]
MRRLRTASVALTALIAVALPAVAGAQSGTYTPADIPGLIDPAVAEEAMGIDDLSWARMIVSTDVPRTDVLRLVEGATPGKLA